MISFEAVAPAGFKTQDDLPMLIIVYGNGSAYSNGLFRLASKVVAFDRTCVWGYGRTFESDALRLKFLVDGELAISFWNNPKTLDWSIRVPTTAEKREKGWSLLIQYEVVGGEERRAIGKSRYRCAHGDWTHFGIGIRFRL